MVDLTNDCDQGLGLLRKAKVDLALARLLGQLLIEVAQLITGLLAISLSEGILGFAELVQKFLTLVPCAAIGLACLKELS